MCKGKIALIFLFLFYLPAIYPEPPSEVDYKIEEHIKEIPSQSSTLSITSKEIELMHSSTLSQVLEKAGLQVQNYGGAGGKRSVTIHALGGKCVKVYVDDVLINSSQSGECDLDAINIEEIKSIKVYKTPNLQNIEDRGFGSSSIYIYTKDKTIGHTLTAKSAFNTFFNANKVIDNISNSISYNGQLGKNNYLNLSTSALYAPNNYLYTSESGKTKEQENNKAITLNNFIGFNKVLPNTSSFYLKNLTYLNKAECGAAENSVDSGVKNSFSNSLLLNFNLPPIDNCLLLKTYLTYSVAGYSFDKTADSNKSLLNTLDTHASLSFTKLNFFTLEAAVFLSSSFLSSSTSGNNALTFLTCKALPSFFIGSIFSITAPISASFSFRSDKNANTFSINPSIKFNFAFPYIDLSLSIYKTITPPSMDDLYWENGRAEKGNPALKNEKLSGASFEIASLNKIVNTSLTFYLDYYKDKIQWRTSNNTLKPSNIAKALFLGLDFMAEKTFLDRINLKLTFSYLYDILLDKSNKATLYNSIMLSPALSGSLSFTLNFSPLYFTIESKYIGERYKTNLNIDTLPSTFLLNCAFDIKLTQSFLLFLKVNNLLNMEARTLAEYPSSKASLTIGVSFNTKIKNN